MPKQKHNKLQQKNKLGSADFKKNFDIKKKKGKVGKGKVAGANATSTQISAKALAMPHSSILKASKDERGLVTARNLSLDELLVQTRHVSGSVRREALVGLRELISEHGTMLRVRMSDILGRAVELLLDSDQSTRQALQLLLQTAFEQISERIIAPFLELLVVYIKSAIAHSTPSMRLDAMGALRVAIAAYPNAIAPRLGGLFPLLFQLLSAAEGDKNNKLERRMTMLRTLFVTLQCAAGEAHRDATATAAVAAAPVAAEEPSASTPADARWTATGTRNVEAFIPRQQSVCSDARSNVNVMSTDGSSGTASSMREIEAFVPVLLPQVWQCWLECCPADLADRARHSRDLLLIMRLLLQLFRPTSHQPSGLGLPVPPNFVSELRRHVLTHCPLRPGADGSAGTIPVMAGQTGTEGVATILAAVDVAVCELVAMVAVGDTNGDGGSAAALVQSSPKQQRKSAASPHRSQAVAVAPQYVWYRRVHDMTLQLLTDESAAVARKGVAAADGIAAFDTGEALVRVASTLLRVSEPAEATALWGGMTTLFKRSRPSEAVQGHLFDLWASDPDAVPASLWKDWLMVLFKLLWELQLQSTNEALSLAILCSLLGCLRRRRKQLIRKGDEDTVLGWGEDTIADNIEALQKAFIPFFCQRTTSRKRRQSAPARLGGEMGDGSDGDQATTHRDVFGPFVRFESADVQRRAIELLFYFNAVSTPLLHAVIKACQMMPQRPHIAAYLMEVLASRKPQLSLSATSTALMSLCSPSSKAMQQAEDQDLTSQLDQWHAVVVQGAGIRWALSLRSHYTGASLVAVAAPTAAKIVQHTAADAYSHRAAGALTLLGALGGGEGVALVGEISLPAISRILVDTHARRRHSSDGGHDGMEMALDDDDDGEPNASAGAPSHAVVDLLRAYPTVLGQLVRTMEELCAEPKTSDQEVVDHLDSLRMFRDARILRAGNSLGGGAAAAAAISAQRAAGMASQRGGRVAQAAAELSALLPAAAGN